MFSFGFSDHPWFAKVTSQQAATTTFSLYNSTVLMAIPTGREAMISETGWPSVLATDTPVNNQGKLKHLPSSVGIIAECRHLGPGTATVNDLNIFLEAFTCPANSIVSTRVKVWDKTLTTCPGIKVFYMYVVIQKHILNKFKCYNAVEFADEPWKAVGFLHSRVFDLSHYLYRERPLRS